MEHNYTPIPVMGTLIVNGVDLLRRLINSVDYPVDEFLIVNNNGRGQIDTELDELVKEAHPHIKKFRVVHMPMNMGCPFGWNFIIKAYMMAPYWFIVSHDVEFSPGLIKEMVGKTIFQPSVGMVHIAISDRLYGSYEAFIIKDWVVAQYGLFDENLYPAYVEDVEYIVRSNGVRWDWGTLPYKHNGRTVEVEPELREKIDAARLLNEWEYMFRRWGDDGWWMTYKGNPELADKYIPWDLNFVRRKYLGF